MFEEAEDDLKVLETTISDLEKSLADGNAEIVRRDQAQGPLH